MLVDRAREEQWAEELQNGGDQNGDEGHDEEPTLRHQIGTQFAERLLDDF
jgi:hypothetical protein